MTQHRTSRPKDNGKTQQGKKHLLGRRLQRLPKCVPFDEDKRSNSAFRTAMFAADERSRRTDFTDHNYSVLSAAISPNETHSPETERVDAIICQFLHEQNVPGATLAIAKHGCVLYEQGYGVAGASRRMRANTALRVASISKTVTAIAVLRLCQEGRLSLDAKVFGATGILKNLKPRGDKRLKQVTVRHLLQHSAGWDRDMAGDAVFKNVTPPDGVSVASDLYNAHLLQHMLFRRLQFTPGYRHAYSNLGYLVLGEVIEAVTGEKYEHYVKSLLAHIGITAMYVGSEERASWQSSEGEYFNIREPAMAASVMPDQPDSSVLPQYGSFLMRNTGAYGGWVATARDLVRLICSLEMRGKDGMVTNVSDTDEQQLSTQHSVLDATWIRAMLERPAYESGRDWYGLGLDVQDGGHTWGHTGAMEGTCATFHRHRSGLSWAFVLNAWASDMDLDGVVKCALSCAPHLSPFPVQVAQVCGKELHVTTADQDQCIMIHVPSHSLLPEIEEKSKHGFTIAWLGVNTVEQKEDGNSSFNAIFSRNPALLGRKKVLSTEMSHLFAALKEFSEEGFYPELITTYVNCGSLRGIAVLAQRQHKCVQEVDICLPVRQYLALLAQRKKAAFHVVCQCVMCSRQTDQLLVTAIMEKNVESVMLKNDQISSREETSHSEDEKLMDTDDGRPEPEQSEHSGQPTPEDSESQKTDRCFEPVHPTIEGRSSGECEAEGNLGGSGGGVDISDSPRCVGAEICGDEKTDIDDVYSECDGSRDEFSVCMTEMSQDAYSDDVEHDKEEGRTKRNRKRKPPCSCVECKHSFLYSSFPLKASARRQWLFSDMATRGKNSPSIQNNFENANSTPGVGTTLAPSHAKAGNKQHQVPRLKTLSYVQLEVESFVTEMGRQAKRSCGLQNVHFFPVDGKWYVSGVWSPAVTHNCYHRLAVSRLGLLPALAEAAAGNVSLKFVCQYEEDGVTYYALFWEGPTFDKTLERNQSSIL